MNKFFQVEVPSEKLNFLLPSVLNCVSVAVNDVTGHGGHISVTITKDVVQRASGVHGVTICSAQLELPPTLPTESSWLSIIHHNNSPN